MSNKILILLTGFLCLFSLGLMAAEDGELARLVDLGNQAFAQEDFPGALKHYQEAGVLAPEDARIRFNEGDVYFRQREFKKARQAYEDAALKTKNLDLEGRARFNLGNVALEQARRQEESDPQKAVELFEEAGTHYKDALRLKKPYEDSAHNLEVSRILLKNLLDKMKQDAENMQQQQQENQEQQEKLEDAIDQQQQQQQQTQDMQQGDQEKKDQDSQQGQEGQEGQEGEQGQDGDKNQQGKDGEQGQEGQPQGKGQENNPENREDAAQQQEQTRQDTEDLAENMNQKNQQKENPVQGESPQERAQRKLEEASKAQQEAEDALRENDLDKAEQKQKEALDKMKDALEDMGGENQPKPGDEQKEGQEGNPGEQDQDGEQQEQDPKPEDGKVPKDQAEEQPVGDASIQGNPGKNTETLEEKPGDILAEERENRVKRKKELAQQKKKQAKPQPVKRDW